MTEPKISRPKFPDGYLEAPKSLLSWSEVEERLARAIHYWVCTTQPNGHPHVVPKWGVWIGQQFYFDGSPETKHARNLLTNPNIAVHLESGEEVVIVYGTGKALSRPDKDTAITVARLYGEKYRALGYAPEPNQWDAGGLFEVTAQKVIAWTKFTDDPTRFVFEGEKNMNETPLSETLKPLINSLLDETFESVQGIFLDKGTSLFETLSGISAEQASRTVSDKCATIAAQVKHVNFYLEVLERYMFENDQSRADWGEVWRTTHAVTAVEWQAEIDTLKTTYARLRERFNSLETWQEEKPLGGIFAILSHTAYHLGEIRQATCVVGCKD